MENFCIKKKTLKLYYKITRQGENTFVLILARSLRPESEHVPIYKRNIK